MGKTTRPKALTPNHDVLMRKFILLRNIFDSIPPEKPYPLLNGEIPNLEKIYKYLHEK